jgi:glycosyltransferase involved in cell wall biosynthesis
MQVAAIADADRMSGSALMSALRGVGEVEHVVVSARGFTCEPDAQARLVDACRAPMAATASPIPSIAAAADRAVAVPLHDDLPPPPTLALGCTELRVYRVDALESVWFDGHVDDALATLAALDRRLANAGWRHVAAPGVGLDWSHPRHHPGGGNWTSGVVDSIEGAANESLSTHQRWLDVHLRPMRVVIDGACLTDDIHNGTQALVFEVARSLARHRRSAQVSVAVKPAEVARVRPIFAADPVDVVPRVPHTAGFDLVYRPYQMLDPAELGWLGGAGHRLLTGQLDMIGFSNVTYHPSPALLHGVRNLQRHTMRIADGVTFISRFGEQTAVAECPDLEGRRRFVVGCGPGSDLGPATDVAAHPLPVDGAFLLCLSSTFWHKNRTHAIGVFADMCTRHGYPGSLVIAGPEPFYGRSTEAEAAQLGSLPGGISGRVIRIGQVDEALKWRLLEAADVVLYPSIVEGFGLVPFESARAGTPCAFARSSALAEVLGPVSSSVDSWRVERWADVVACLVGSPEAAAAAVAEVDAAGHSHTWAAVAERTWTAIDATLARPRANRYHEEGDLRSRIAGVVTSPAAPVTHFGNRLVAYARRRIAGLPRLR